MASPNKKPADRWKDLVSKLRDDVKHEKESEAHALYRSEPGHAPKGTGQTNAVENVVGIQAPGSTGPSSSLYPV
jgi:hypothetical protein